ncbi:MAG: pyridoxal phosphate-dependent aminotransferase [Candidatus Hydrogenedentota bacterium]
MMDNKQKVVRNKDFPKSIRSVIRMYPSNQVNRMSYGGLPYLGNTLLNSWKSIEIQEAAKAYENYSLSSNLLIKGFKNPVVDKVRLGIGSPARFKPFSRCITSIKHALKNRVLSDYQLAAGDSKDKAPIIKYFRIFHDLEIVENNIIFTHSSTQAFTFIMETILDYGDVVIMTAPNYGLFAFIPERIGGKVKLLPLTSFNNWKINPKELKQLISSTNNELRRNYKMNRGGYVFRHSDVPPRISAFLNLNPHNPTGIVYSKKDESLLLEISNICNNAGVFIIDDLAYFGLEFNRNSTVLPICSLKGHFDNTITLYSLSKPYGLAGLRSGMLIANETIISLIRDKIFQNLDSLSLLQSAAMGATFLSENNALMEREKYFTDITRKYYERYIFAKAIIIGTDKINKKERILLNKIIKNNRLIFDIKKTMNGIKDISIVLEPESGFFILLDLSKLLGKTYKGFRIVDDATLLKFLYTSGNIKLLTGKAICWPNQDQLIARVTIAFDKYEDLLKSFLRLKSSIELLT